MITTQNALVEATILLGFLNALGALAVVGCLIGWLALKLPAVKRWLDLP